jgi:hypothetical protein
MCVVRVYDDVVVVVMCQAMVTDVDVVARKMIFWMTLYWQRPMQIGNDCTVARISRWIGGGSSCRQDEEREYVVGEGGSVEREGMTDCTLSSLQDFTKARHSH